MASVFQDTFLRIQHMLCCSIDACSALSYLAVLTSINHSLMQEIASGTHN